MAAQHIDLEALIDELRLATCVDCSVPGALAQALADPCGVRVLSLMDFNQAAAVKLHCHPAGQMLIGLHIYSFAASGADNAAAARGSALEELPELRALVHLGISWEGIRPGDIPLAPLPGCSALRSLSVSDEGESICSLSQRDVDSIAAMTQLQRLQLVYNVRTPLNQNGVSLVSLEPLASLTQLDHMYACGNAAGLAVIGRLSSLTSLQWKPRAIIGDPEMITVGALSGLSGLTGLQSLTIEQRVLAGGAELVFTQAHRDHLTDVLPAGCHITAPLQ